MLRACRQVLESGGRLAFVTIQSMPGLSPERRRLANRVGPPAGGVRTSYESLLHSAGFVEIAAIDVTAEYGATQRRWMAATDRLAEPIRRVVGAEAYAERARTRQATVDAINDGLLGRFMYAGTRR